MNPNAPESPQGGWQYAGENLRRRKSSGVYYAFVKRGRKQFRHSLKTTDKAFARRRPADFVRDVDRLASAEAKNVTFADVAARRLETTRHTLKAGTLRHRQTCLKAVTPFFLGQSIRHLTARHCEEWLLKFLHGQGMDRNEPQLVWPGLFGSGATAFPCDHTARHHLQGWPKNQRGWKNLRLCNPDESLP